MTIPETYTYILNIKRISTNPIALLSHSCNEIDIVILKYHFDCCWNRLLLKVRVHKSLLGTETIISEFYVVVMSEIHIVRIIFIISQRKMLTFTRLLRSDKTLLNTFNVFHIVPKIEQRAFLVVLFYFKSYFKTRDAREQPVENECLVVRSKSLVYQTNRCGLKRSLRIFPLFVKRKCSLLLNNKYKYKHFTTLLGTCLFFIFFSSDKQLRCAVWKFNLHGLFYTFVIKLFGRNFNLV